VRASKWDSRHTEDGWRRVSGTKWFVGYGDARLENVYIRCDTDISGHGEGCAPDFDTELAGKRGEEVEVGQGEHGRVVLQSCGKLLKFELMWRIGMVIYVLRQAHLCRGVAGLADCWFLTCGKCQLRLLTYIQIFCLLLFHPTQGCDEAAVWNNARDRPHGRGPISGAHVLAIYQIYPLRNFRKYSMWIELFHWSQ